MKKTFFTLLFLLVFSLLNAQNNMLDFDGGNDYVTIPDDNSLDLTTLTIEAWIYPTDLSSWKGIIDKNWSYQLAYNYLGQLVGNIGGYTTGGDANTLLGANKWQHVVMSYGDGEAKLYINGDFKLSYNLSIPTTNDDPLVIGRYDNDNSKCFPGKIDEVRIWNDVRTEAEIRANMYKELAGTESNLVAYYKLNEINLTTPGYAADFSNNSNNGTYEGSMTNDDCVTSSVFAGPKNCLDFDGLDDYVDIGTGPTTVKSVEFWVYPTTTTENFIDLNGAVYIGSSLGIILATGFTSPTIYVDGIVSSTIVSGKWQHIAVTSTTSENASALKIGKVNLLYLQGKIDEVRLWSLDRPVDSIRNYMCRKLNVDETGLVAYYNFDNNSGTTLQDFSGNSNDGILTLMDPATDWISSSAFNTWLNVVNTSWATATNWSRGSIPDLNDNVGIPNYGESHPTMTGTTACNNMVVGNGVTLTHYTGSHTIHGSAFVIGHSDINNGYFLTVTKNLYILLLSTLNIDPGGQLTIGNKLDIWATGTCTVKSDADGTGSLIVSGTSSGNIIFERYVDDIATKGDPKWHYVSAPVAGQALDGTWMTANDIVNTPPYQFFRWDEDTDYWIYFDYVGNVPEDFDDDTFVEARGYCLTKDGAGELSFEGTIRTDNSPYTATYTEGQGDGFNLVGNPFTSSIGITSNAPNNFLNDNNSTLDVSYQAVYIWNEQAGYSDDRNDYAVICNVGYTGFGSGSALPQNYVQPGQAFFIKVVDSDKTIAFNKNTRYHSTDNFYKSGKKNTWPGMELIVKSGDTLQNSTIIAFNNEMTLGLDPSYDVGKLKGNPNIALYTKLIQDNGIDFAIQALPYFEQDYSVKVGLDITNAGEYTFTAATMEQIPEDVYVYFEDKLTSTVTNFKETDNYTCSISETGSTTNRFVLHFTSTPFSADEINANQSNIQIWSANKTINILNPENLKGQIRIVNMYGQKLIETRLNGNDRQQITINIPTGNYVVNVINENFSLSKKVFVK